MGLNTRIVAAKDKEDHQEKQKQRGMEKSNATKINSVRSLHLEGFTKMKKKLAQVPSKKDMTNLI